MVRLTMLFGLWCALATAAETASNLPAATTHASPPVASGSPPAINATPALSDPVALRQAALAAEARLDSQRALDLFLALERLQPNDAGVLQKIARQYSDRLVDLNSDAERRESAAQALAYAQRAVALAPRDAVNVLSVAISYGKLALFSDTSTKVKYSRLVREEAERALRLDPNYSWAHHVLGRWHYEVADLGGASRLFVKVFHGGLPEASVAESSRHLRRAVELEPGELAHHLELGFAYLAAADRVQAEAAFAQGLALPSRAKHDEAAKTRARAALQKK